MMKLSCGRLRHQTFPIISAIGHETDTTLIDHAADWRAPTPTAAAERAVPVRADLLAETASLLARQRRAIARVLQERKLRLQSAARALPKPDDMLAIARQRLDRAAGRLPAALRANVQRHGVGACARRRASSLRQTLQTNALANSAAAWRTRRRVAQRALAVAAGQNARALAGRKQVVPVSELSIRAGARLCCCARQARQSPCHWPADVKPGMALAHRICRWRGRRHPHAKSRTKVHSF